MGRLIDAGKLLKTMMTAKEWSDKHGGDKYSESFRNDSGEISVEWWCVEDMVDNAETVDAIPVEWINDYLTWLHDMNSVFGNRNALAIKAMLKKWEMEHETGCTDSCPIDHGGSK